MLNLANVTIVSINTRDPLASVKAIERSCKYIEFGKCMLLSDRTIAHDFIEPRIIPGIGSKQDYSYFCVKELHRYIDTEHCLLVQPDGFVTNPLMWSDEFLTTDYIGAPWDLRLSRKALLTCGIDYTKVDRPVPVIVGNGGFSLRSRRLLYETSLLNYTNTDVPEDNFICILARKALKEKGIRFANLKLAKRFSLETPIHSNVQDIDIDAQFGFHGNYIYNKPLLALLEDYEKDVESVRIAKRIWG